MVYKDLEIWQIASELVTEIHSMTLKDLPKFEMYETGSQIRRSMQSVKANIAEGFSRRRYKNDFIHFLTISLGSAYETTDHLETLYQTKSLNNEKKFELLHDRIDKLGRKIYLFIQTVERSCR